MTDLEAKFIAVKLVREWAHESGEAVCEECGGMGYIFQSAFLTPVELCETCRGTGENPRFDITEFVKWLDEATKIVETWPQWKRSILAETGI